MCSKLRVHDVLKFISNSALKTNRWLNCVTKSKANLTRLYNISQELPLHDDTRRRFLSHSNFTQSLIPTFPFARRQKKSQLQSAFVHVSTIGISSPQPQNSLGWSNSSQGLHSWLCSTPLGIFMRDFVEGYRHRGTTAWTSYLSNIFLREDCLPRLASARYNAGPFHLLSSPPFASEQ